MKKNLIVILSLIFAQYVFSQNEEITEVKNLIEKVSSWQNKQTDHIKKYTLTNWHFSAYYIGLMRAYKTTGNKKYYNHLYDVGKTHNWETPYDMYHADKIAIGQLYLDLFDKEKKPEIIKNLKWVLDAHIYRTSPEPDVRYLNNPYNKEWWTWCDALFMAPPTFAKMYKITGEKKYLDYAIKHWFITTDYLWDSKENLIYRDDRYFNLKTSSEKKIFWSRGNGWVYAGLVHMLEIIPEGHPKRPDFIRQFKGMSKKLLDIQERSSDGLWRSNLLDPGIFAYLNKNEDKLIETEKIDIPENSGSSFFCYGFAWGINNGILDKDLFMNPMISAWKMLKSHVNSEGRLGFIQPVGKDPKPYDKNSWQEFGTGAFLLAASEYINFLNKEKKNISKLQKGNLIYKNDLNSKESIHNWSMEGSAKTVFKNGWMEMFSPNESSHHVLWCPEKLPSSFIAEWEIQNLNLDAGLCIVFFAANGTNGEDILDNSLKKRNGVFNQYTKSDLNNYHISYYANNPKKPDRPFTHLRKNKGFKTVQFGQKGIPAKSKNIHKIQLVKSNGRIIMNIDGNKLIDWIDNGKELGPILGSGKLAFRQMQWTHFRYKNFKVWDLISIKDL